MQAQKALGRSGRVFGGTLMVGVVPCADPGNLDSSHLESSVFGGVTTVPPHHESVAAESFALPNANSTLNTTKSIRPLTQSYRMAQKDLDVRCRLKSNRLLFESIFSNNFRSAPFRLFPTKQLEL